MKTINHTNLEKITHNIHKKIDDITSIFKYRDKPSYRVVKVTAGKWHILKIVSIDRDFMTGAVLDELITMIKKYMKVYSNILYCIDVHREYNDGRVCLKAAFCIQIEIDK